MWHEFVDAKPQLFTLKARELCKKRRGIYLQDEPSVTETDDPTLALLALGEDLFQSCTMGTVRLLRTGLFDDLPDQFTGMLGTSHEHSDHIEDITDSSGPTVYVPLMGMTT